MKSKIILAVMILFFFTSCTVKKQSSEMTQTDKDRINIEIESVLNSIKDGMKELNSENAFMKNIYTKDFKYIGVRGEMLDFPEFIETVNGMFNSAKKAEFNYSKNDIRILSKDIAIVNYHFNGTFYFDDSKLYFPDCACSYVMRKTEEGWKAIQFQESIQESTFIISQL